MLVNHLTKTGFVSLMLTISFTGTLTGNSPFFEQLEGVSPGHFPVLAAADGYFSRISLDKLKMEKNHQKDVEERILNVISEYKTGLKDDDLERVPQSIYENSKKYGYDPLFLTAVIVTESSFYNWARSNRGALGLMQIRPGTGVSLASETNLEWKGKPTLYDPETNIALGAYYLDKLLKQFGDLSLALEAYNQGPTELVRHLREGHRPKSYSQKVFRVYEQIRSV